MLWYPILHQGASGGQAAGGGHAAASPTLAGKADGITNGNAHGEEVAPLLNTTSATEPQGSTAQPRLCSACLVDKSKASTHCPVSVAL